MKKITAIILLSAISFSSVAANAEIHFDVEKVKWENKAIYDITRNAVYSMGYEFDWTLLDDIPTIDMMPEPNVIWLYDTYKTKVGYISQINGCYYLSGMTGEKAMPLPVVPIGDTLPENIEQYRILSETSNINQFPYNAKNVDIKYEVEQFNDEIFGVKHSGTIAKWVLCWDDVSKKTYIFANGINSIKTNLNFRVNDAPMLMKRDDFEIMFWEDDTKFYIRNYNILLSTDKETFYAAMDELEAAPKVKYQDTYLAFEQAPVIENDRTLIPIRFLFEQMGATVDWDGDTQTATITQDNTAITFAIDNTEADVNGQTVIMDVPTRLINGKTMVPVRFLSEHLGYDVEWDAETRVITIE